MSGSPLRRSTFLETSGVEASWRPDPDREDGWVLFVGDDEQSTVIAGRPDVLVYEYLARMGTAIDLALAPGPIAALHLGGGALSLPRFVEATRPGSTQVVVDLDAELMPFVFESFPLASPARTRLRIADAVDELRRPEHAGAYDLAVLDIALGPDSPAALLDPDLYARLFATLRPGGLALVNVGDEPDFDTTRGIARALSTAGASVWVTGQADVLSGDYTGNLVVGASHRRWPAERLQALREAGPHPAGLLVGLELQRLGEP